MLSKLTRLVKKRPRSLRQRFPDAEERELTLFTEVAPYTMTSPECLWGLIRAVTYVSSRKIVGDYVECGVWRGGSSMTAALQFLHCKDLRRLWLYDTFQGMPAPTKEDRKLGGDDAREKWEKTSDGEFSDWCRASLEDVRANMARTKYPGEIRYVVGKVQDTLKREKPEGIALLRLDTDFYESTKVELEMLYPLLSEGGVLIVDDYGSWGGSKQAVDEYFANRPMPMMNRLDHSGRLILKV